MRNWFFSSSLLLIHPIATEIYMALERDRKEHWSICTCIRHPCQLQLTPSLYFYSLKLIHGSSHLVKCTHLYGFQSNWAAGKVPVVFLQPTNTTFHYLFWNWCFSLKILCSLIAFLLLSISTLLSKICIELWGFIIQCVTSTCALNLTSYICKTWIGLSHIFNFFSWSPSSSCAFLSCALK